MTGGKRGPSPKTSALRLVEGTDSKGRSGRQLDRSREPVPPAAELAPPYPFEGPHALDLRAVWDQTVADLTAMGVAHGCDANQLAIYVEAVVLFRRAARLLTESPILVRGDRALVINKAVLVQERAGATMLRLAQEFGLTPASRTRIETNTGQAAGQPAGGGGRVAGNPFAN